MKQTLTNKEEMLMNIFRKHGSMFFRDLAAHLILIPLLAACVLACNPAKKNKTPDPTAGTTPEVVQETAPEAIPYQLVEQKPSFQGGDVNDFARWMNDHLTWPEEAKDIDVQGRVTLQFTVDTDGSVVNAKVLQSLTPILDEEALRVVNSSTKKWAPGIQNGQPVPVVYTFPVIFRLK